MNPATSSPGSRSSTTCAGSAFAERAGRALAAGTGLPLRDAATDLAPLFRSVISPQSPSARAESGRQRLLRQVLDKQVAPCQTANRLGRIWVFPPWTSSSSISQIGEPFGIGFARRRLDGRRQTAAAPVYTSLELRAVTPPAARATP